MRTEVVAKSYWRSILRGTRTFSVLPAEMRSAVREVARQETASGAVTPEQYAQAIGEAYPAEAEEAAGHADQ